MAGGSHRRNLERRAPTGPYAGGGATTRAHSGEGALTARLETAAQNVATNERQQAGAGASGAARRRVVLYECTLYGWGNGVGKAGAAAGLSRWHSALPALSSLGPEGEHGRFGQALSGFNVNV